MSIWGKPGENVFPICGKRWGYLWKTGAAKKIFNSRKILAIAQISVKKAAAIASSQ